jgi:nucleoside phosphorylase
MIVYVVALPSEARPLIDFYKMVKQRDCVFDVYAADGVALIVSGIGQHNATLATGFMAGWLNSENIAWLNVGIAGHPHAEIGSLFVAAEVRSVNSGRRCYPAFIRQPHIKRAAVMTFDAPEQNYAHDFLCDMESYAFVQAAARFSNIERVHCLKVVSDNRDNAADQVTPEIAGTLIKKHVDAIHAFATEINQLQYDGNASARLSIWLDKLQAVAHFSEYQQRQLKRALQKAIALSVSEEALVNLKEHKKAKEILQSLERAISRAYGMVS